MGTTAYAIIAIFCLLFIAAAVALIHYRERCMKAENQRAMLENKYRAVEHTLSRLIAEKTALQTKFDDTVGSVKVITVINPERRNGETEAGYARRCRMSIGNKAAQYAKIRKQQTELHIYITK